MSFDQIVDHLCWRLGQGPMGLLDLTAPGAWDGLDPAGARPKVMILTLHIDKEEPGLYLARVLDGHAKIAEFQAATIFQAIRDCAGVAFPSLDGFHVGYSQVCIGTTSLYAMRHDAETLPQRLVSLHSQFDD